MPDDGHPFIPTLPRAFPQENPPDEAFRTGEYKAYLSFKDWAPARWLARTEDERRELVTERLRARAERWADAHEDFRRYWDCYGEVPHRARVYVPYPAVSDEWWPDLHPIVAVADQTPPWRNESFRQWRDRALADFVRPDLSREERLAYFRERFDRVPDILSIDPTRGRGYLFIPQRARSTAPAMEAELLEDRRDAGDELVSPVASRGTFVLPAVNVRRNYAFGTLTWGGQVPGNIRARRTVAATPEERRRKGRGDRRDSRNDDPNRDPAAAGFHDTSMSALEYRPGQCLDEWRPTQPFPPLESGETIVALPSHPKRGRAAAVERDLVVPAHPHQPDGVEGHRCVPRRAANDQGGRCDCHRDLAPAAEAASVGSGGRQFGFRELLLGRWRGNAGWIGHGSPGRGTEDILDESAPALKRLRRCERGRRGRIASGNARCLQRRPPRAVGS